MKLLSMKLLLRVALMLFSALGIIWILCLYAFAFRASQILGHWPIPMINDPKLIQTDDFWYRILGDLTFFGAPLAALSIIGVPCALSCAEYWYREYVSSRVLKISVALYLVSLSLGFTVCAFDPGWCWEWVLD